MKTNEEELSPVALEMKVAKVNPERQTAQIQQISSQPTKVPTRVTSQPDKKVDQPRLSLVDRQSLLNTSRPTTSTPTDPNPTKKRRTSSLHKPLPQSLPHHPLPSLDIFRFPSESPPKQSVKPSHQPRPPKPTVEDKENGPPPPSWPVVIGGRERRKTFNLTMERLAQLTREENQADRDWEAEIAAKRRRQSVAI